MPEEVFDRRLPQLFTLRFTSDEKIKIYKIYTQ